MPEKVKSAVPHGVPLPLVSTNISVSYSRLDNLPIPRLYPLRTPTLPLGRSSSSLMLASDGQRKHDQALIAMQMKSALCELAFGEQEEDC